MADRDYTILLKVRADLQDALGKVKNLDSSLHSLKNTGLGLAGALGVGFSIAGIVDFIKSTIDADQHIGNLSKTLGISTEALSALQAEAKKAGVDIDSLGAALVNLSKGATRQNAEGAKALQAMGINAKDAAGNIKPLSTLLQEAAVKFTGYQDGTAKAALATAVFGRAGAQLIPLLDEIGSEGLDNITQKAIAAGTALSQDAVDSANAFSNALDDLKKNLRAAVNDGLEQFTPEIKDLAQEIEDPQFQQAIRDTAEGVLAVGARAFEAAAHIAEFARRLGEAIAAEAVGPYDADRISARIGEIDDKIKQLNGTLAKPVGSRISEFLQDLARGPNTNVGVASDEVTKSTDAIKQEIAQLEKERVALQARAKLFQAPNGPPGSTSGAADDFINGILGGGGKGNAPTLGAVASAGADTAKAMAAVLQQLQGQLAALRTQGLDPAATAWAQYNKTVADATALAAKAGNTTDALAARDAISAQAKRIRDAALADIAKKDRDAYEQLKQSLASPVEAKLDDARRQLEALNKALKDGVIDAQEYAAQFQKISANAFTSAPDFQGLSPQIGGASSEFTRLDEASQKLQAWYAEQQQLNEQFYSQQLESEDQYQQRALALDEAFGAKKKEIGQATLQVSLTQLTGSLDQSVNLIGQAFGTQSRAYRIAFDISKAAAIAQATVAMFQSIAEASKVGFPANIAVMAEALAQGLAIVADIRAVEVGPAAATGGLITGPGTATSDSIPARLSTGEFVMRAAAVQQYGVDSMRAINAGRVHTFAGGGMVSDAIVPPAPSYPDAAGARAAVMAIGSGEHARNAGGAATPTVGVRIVNVTNPRFVTESMNSSEGETVIMNTISRNQTKIRQMVR